jgi:hypothetical protein
MKKHLALVVTGFMLMGLVSCFHHRNDLSITISDNDDEYEMDALYNKRKTHAVRIYLDERLLDKKTGRYKKNIDREEITLDDHTKLYLDAYPGSLRIKIDKDENSPGSYKKIKQACEEIKEIMLEN